MRHRDRTYAQLNRDEFFENEEFWAAFSTNPTMRHLTHFCVTSVHINQERVVLDEGNSCAAGNLESAEIRHFWAHGDRRRRVARRASAVNLASISHYLKRLSKK
jgi:hypothetical protein